MQKETSIKTRGSCKNVSFTW